jgi:hypothetical protein
MQQRLHSPIQHYKPCASSHHSFSLQYVPGNRQWASYCMTSHVATRESSSDLNQQQVVLPASCQSLSLQQLPAHWHSHFSSICSVHILTAALLALLLLLLAGAVHFAQQCPRVVGLSSNL